MAEIVTCLVRGPASRYPRGYLALIPVWFAILAGAVVLVSDRLSGRMPRWLGLTETGALLLVAAVLLGVLATLRRHAFRADRGGIWLGVASTRRRPGRRILRLGWSDIAQIRMVSRRYGLLLEITLVPSVRAYRPGLPRQAGRLLGALIFPFMFGRANPGLTLPTGRRPRYLVKICAMTPADLAAALAAVTPQTVPVRVLTRRRLPRLVVPQPRRPVDGRPAPAIRR